MTKIPDNVAPAHPQRVNASDDNWRIEAGLVRAPARLAPGQWLSYGFTARPAGDFLTDEAARRLVAQLVAETGGAKELKLLRQVHGTVLLQADTAACHTQPPEGDGWVGSPPAELLLGVRTADCLPLILWSDQTRRVAVVHAGWRGAVAGISSKALREMNCAPEGVRALIGPSIGPCCFEVEADVVEAAGDDVRWIAPSPEKIAGKYHLDLPRYVVEDLVGAGMKREAIGTAPYCTRCDERFFSHRRGDKGRLCAFAARRR